MAITKGALTVCGLKKGAVWNTPVAAGAGDGIGYTGETFSSAVELIPDQSLTGSVQQLTGDAGPKMFAGEVNNELRYEDVAWVAVAMVMGTAGAPTTVDASAMKHVLKMANVLEGLFATLAFDKSIEVHEFKSVKFTGFALNCTRDKAKLTIRAAASDLDTASTTNTSVTMATVTMPANRSFLLFRQMVVRANAQDGAALDDDDVIHVAGISIDVDRGLKVDDITTARGNVIEEPTQETGGWTVTKVSLELSKFKDGTGGTAPFRAAVESKAPQKMDITITGDTLAGAAVQKYQAVFYLNNVQFTDGIPNVSGPGITPYSINGQAYRATAAPSGFPTGYTDNLTIELYNQRATDLLA